MNIIPVQHKTDKIPLKGTSCFNNFFQNKYKSLLSGIINRNYFIFEAWTIRKQRIKYILACFSVIESAFVLDLVDYDYRTFFPVVYWNGVIILVGKNITMCWCRNPQHYTIYKFSISWPTFWSLILYFRTKTSSPIPFFKAILFSCTPVFLL